METVSFKVPPLLRRRLAEEARRRGVSQSTVIRETLEAALLSCADLAGDLIGCFRGPGDLSTNKRYLDEAIVADARRAQVLRR